MFFTSLFCGSYSLGERDLAGKGNLFVVWASPGCFMNFRRETVEMAVPPGNRRELDPRRT